jgi:dienelactone hydrolase
LSCSLGPTVVPADRAALQASLAFPAAGGPLALERGPAVVDGGVTVRPVSFDLRPGWSVSGALFEPVAPGPVGVVVAQGHFGQGKSAPEAQEIAWRLARRGVRVLAVDTPGMEEWDRPSRHVHFDEGAHNRGYLAAGGTSALALQVAQLRRGLDVLASLGSTRFGATGASGGAVQSFFVAVADDRVEAVVLASPPPLPKEARAGGCPCDQLPGWPGPDPAVIAALPVPSLWLADGLEGTPPAGLNRQARYRRTAGPHSYTAEMQDLALDFFADELGVPGAATGRDGGPLTELRMPDPPSSAPGIRDLPLKPTARWSPAVGEAAHHELDCAGRGPVVLVAGADASRAAALQAQGLKTCLVRVPEDVGARHAAIATQGDPVAPLAGGLQAAAERTGAVGIYARRAWALPAAALGVPYVVEQPVPALTDLDPAQDPPWIHVPGAWWGALDPVWKGATETGKDPALLAAALARAVTPGARAVAPGD